MQNLNNYNIILASKSPRRSQLLSEIGIDFSVEIKEDVEEKYPSDLKHEDIAVFLSQLKAKPFLVDIQNDSSKIVITADTIVCAKGKVLGKPKDKAEATEMLKLLSGIKHQVISGVTISSKQKVVSFSVSTDVYFKYLTEAEIEYYINNYKPFDKAGAYGIQEWIGMIGIEKIEGSYFNVVGLPVQRLYEELNQF
ncbi:Maf family nucleotide pyrophosphatase [Saccharicrinis aurantiacus]|uniref:Maf family nucleotide pyrophosphatase n=1 Tax=Saccharicrinis aurantiacus TaxID=1849719 RepID=UPI0008385AE3|nr:Maf family nucleotide pyrophosphatase [Saccharicrinis aurantiacus]